MIVSNDEFDSTSILGLVIATCHHTKAFRELFSKESIENLSDLSDISTLLINFQPDWDNKSISRALKLLDKYDINYEYCYNEYKIDGNKIPFNKIRNDAAKLKNCKFYLLTDDDMTFKSKKKSDENSRSSSDQLIDSIHYMTTHPKCGILSLRNRLRKKWQDVPGDIKIKSDYISPTPLNRMYNTGNGLIIRNAGKYSKDSLFPSSCLSLLGAGEEKILAANILSYGYYPAMMKGSRISDSSKYVNDCNWDDRELMSNNNEKYIKNHYNKDYGGYNHYDFVDIENYKNKGGYIYDKKSSKELSVDYSSSDIEEELEEIINYWNHHRYLNERSIFK